MRSGTCFVVAALLALAQAQCLDICCTEISTCNYENTPDGGSISSGSIIEQPQERNTLDDDDDEGFLDDVRDADNAEERGFECVCSGACCRTCTSDLNCNTCSGFGCLNGVCQSGQTSACPTNTVCNGLLAPPNHCVECIDDDDCTDGTCDTSSWTCVPNQTIVNDDSDDDATSDDAADETTSTTSTAGDDTAQASSFLTSPPVLIGLGSLLALVLVGAMMLVFRRDAERNNQHEFHQGNPRMVMSLSEIPGLKGNTAQAGVLYSKPRDGGGYSGGRKNSGGGRGGRKNSGGYNNGYGR